MTAHRTNGYYLFNETVKDVITAEDFATIYITLGQVQYNVSKLLEANVVVNKLNNLSKSAQLLLSKALTKTLNYPQF